MEKKNKKKYGTCALEEDDSQGSDQTIEVVRVTMTFTRDKKKNVRKWWIFASLRTLLFFKRRDVTGNPTIFGPKRYYAPPSTNNSIDP
jgi:hypothetical protein